MIQLIMIREFLKRVDKRVIGIVVVLLAASVFFVYQTIFLDASLFGVDPAGKVTSPSAIDLYGYHSKSGDTYTHYIPLTIEFTDPSGNMSNVLVFYSFTEEGIGIEFLNRDFELHSDIYGYYYTKAVIVELVKPDPIPDNFYIYVETQLTLEDGLRYGDKVRVQFRKSYNIELTENEKTASEELATTPISIISHNPPSGLGSAVSIEFMIIPIVLTVLAFKRRERN